jgi:hypothetical protein
MRLGAGGPKPASPLAHGHQHGRAPPADVARLHQACFLVVTWETAPMAGARTNHSPMVTTIEVT